MINLDISLDEVDTIFEVLMSKDKKYPLCSSEYDICIKLAKYAGYSEKTVQHLEELKKTKR